MDSECRVEHDFAENKNIFKATIEEYQNGGDTRILGDVEEVALLPDDIEYLDVIAWLNSPERILETENDMEDLRVLSLSLRKNLKDAITDQTCKNVTEEHGQVNNDKNKEENDNMTRQDKESKRRGTREVKAGAAYRFSKYTKHEFDVWRWFFQSQKVQR
ncbi:hypothetical protein POM88_006339 [Heracleum sosnowskyi]|uniref:Uncharacterized protein n=1 Tax=Heracleum sosnowskyi TaxID=360622 RepID=A0AAD8J5A1_9APIA|nr:hypothetical protein POM88_006339 [Heracleum sosnowskyi]